ncbi:hypothetical protein [Niabella beijingensis]|uniref:hypothetical protein n=1 Tax=Niabella beijingensis TaxID=2872700 RepID=UPI001CC0735A|nr:hypothetical protein [Niabella beijingensis]MBZ4189162.1 hypothetical protein [Niabella beijingensis]
MKRNSLTAGLCILIAAMGLVLKSEAALSRGALRGTSPAAFAGDFSQLSVGYYPPAMGYPAGIPYAYQYDYTGGATYVYVTISINGSPYTSYSVYNPPTGMTLYSNVNLSAPLASGTTIKLEVQRLGGAVNTVTYMVL